MYFIEAFFSVSCEANEIHLYSEFAKKFFFFLSVKHEFYWIAFLHLLIPHGFSPLIHVLICLFVFPIKVQNDLWIHLAQPWPPLRQRSCQETGRILWLSGRCGLWEDQNFHSNTPNIVYLGRAPCSDACQDCPLSTKGNLTSSIWDKALILCSYNWVECFLWFRKCSQWCIFLHLCIA